MSSSSSSSSSLTTNNITSSNNTLVVFNSAAQTPIKLTSLNYSVWKLQYTSLLSGYGKLGFLDGSFPCPTPTITTVTAPSSPTAADAATITKENPAYDNWVKQDQFLLNCIVGSLAPEVLPSIAHVKSSKQAWDILATIYASPSRGRIKQLKLNLRSYQRGQASVSTFFAAVRSKADELQSLEAPIDPEDLVEIIFANIGPEYNDIARAIQARDTLISLDELHEKLLNHEASLNGAAAAASHPIYSAFMATPAAAVGSQTTRVAPPASSATLPTSAVSQQPATVTHQPYTPRYTHSRGGYNQSRGNYQRGGSSQYSSRGGYQGRCQLCGTHGHSAKWCPTYPYFQQNPGPRPSASRTPHQANPTQFGFSPWMLDSGASHHMTHDLSLLSLHDPYSGTEGSQNRGAPPSGSR